MKIPTKQNVMSYLPCFFYCVCILAATFIRWMNYFNCILLAVILFQIFRTGKITKSLLNLLWAVFIFMYPIADAKLRGESGLSLFTLLCYLVPLGFMLSADYNTDDCVKPFLYFLKLAAWLQASGVYLSIVWNKLYLRIAWKLVTDISTNLKGFASDATVAAFYLCIGVGIYWLEARKYRRITSEGVKALAMAFVLFVALAATGKRSFLLIFFIAVIIIEIIAASDRPGKLFRVLTVSACCVLAVMGICYVCYTAGQSNAFSRLWETLIGILNNEDVSSMRSKWAEYMAEWGKENRVFGIGWESFTVRLRAEYSGHVPNGHNVYKQILCEEGWIGFCVYVLLVLISCAYAVLLVLQKKKENNQDLYGLAKCGCFIVIVFAIYCYFGNAIYDAVIYLPFFYTIKMLHIIKCTHPKKSGSDQRLYYR